MVRIRAASFPAICPQSRRCDRDTAGRRRTFAKICPAGSPPPTRKSSPSCYNKGSPIHHKMGGKRMDRAGAVTLQGRPFTLCGPELRPGDKAPDFTLVDFLNRPVTLADTGNKVRIVSVVPSLDTPVCDAQTRRLN